jgi:hypothetical protein
MNTDGTTWAAQSAVIQRGLDLAGLHGVSVVGVSVGNYSAQPEVHIYSPKDRSTADILRAIGGVWKAQGGPTGPHLTTVYDGCGILIIDTDGSCAAVYGATVATDSIDWSAA